MKVIGLDLSTKTGYAIIEDGILSDFGLIKPKHKHTYPIEDFNMIARSKEISDGVYKVFSKHLPDFVFIEQTNSGKFRASQKQLEFIHYAVLDSLLEEAGIVNTVKYVNTSQWRSVLEIKLSKEQKKHNLFVKNKLARGKITSKHLAVNWANKKFNLSLKMKDNDIADAICIAYSGWIQTLKLKQNRQSLNSALFN